MKDSTLTTRKATKPRRYAPKGFDYSKVPTPDRVALQGHEAEFRSVARKDIAEVFAHAERLLDAKERLPKRYGEWVKKACKGISIRMAGYYTAAYERFNDRIDEVVALDILPSHLYAMTKAPDPAIEEIFGRAAAGETVTGADVTRIVKLHEDPSETDPGPKADRPMKKGLLAFMKPPTNEAVDTWFRLLEELHGLLVAALPDGVMKTRLLKEELRVAVEARGGWLLSEITRLTGYNPYRIDFGASGTSWHPRSPHWPDGHWFNAIAALRKVATVRTVSAKALEQHIRSEIIPPLEWALGRAFVDPMAEFAGDEDGGAPEGAENDNGDGQDDASASSAAA